MAKRGNSGSEPRGEHSMKADGMIKKGDILTASKGAMEPCDYSKGYPPNNNELLNKNFAQRGGKK